ncbi:MAG: 5'-methylthioadenosine/S-adenosylhomocysteine nucleosidase [Spirochaetia bacterium]|nr:5'-methylthioadenosine/S-adenosylhomocysteine nucleosidase [Spirochaetia bacterium]
MKKIGLIVAIETDSIFAHYKNVEKLDSPSGFELYVSHKDNCDLFILHAGMGEVAAAAGTQYLISACHVELVVNFGVVGGLTEDMGKHKIVVVQRVVHYRYDASEFMDVVVGQVPPHSDLYVYPDRNLMTQALMLNTELMPVTCASGDKFISSADEKKSIHDRFSADICEMEAAGIVLTCEVNDVPCLLLKAVSDGLTGGAGEFYSELQKAALSCLQVTDKIIEGIV